ncbi:LysR family transcriptional regulator [Tritonibacter mobilis]|nr:LysR family transcriptional regulator [Tritonibacter mobilis]
MTFGQLEIFVALSEAQSFTLTARRLGISQPAVSHALKSLETALNVSLFDRQGSQIVLTPIGAQLLERAREILGLSRTMQQEAASFRGLDTGNLRIGSFGATSSLQLLPDLMSAFHRAYPGIDVFIEEAADDIIVKWLEERRIDMGFVVLPDDRFETIPIATDQFVALVPRQSALAKQERVTLSDLCNDPFIMPESGSVKIVSALFAAAGLTPQTRYRTSQLLSTLSMVGRGQGVSVVAEMAVPAAHPDAPWVIRPLSPAHPRMIGLALHPTAVRSPAVTAFLRIAKTLRTRPRGA